MKLKQLISLGCLVSALLLAACGGGGGIGGTGAPMGTLRFSLTDAPACGYDQVNVTIEKVRVHQSATAADADSGWSEIVLATPRRVDLLTLTNGVLEELGQAAVPAGRYIQLRLVLADNTPATPLANSVVPTGGTETALTTPSGQQSGLKLNADLVVPAGQVADFVIDFDACKSVVVAGNSGRYNLKPVLSVTPRLSVAGLRVEGYVDPAIALTSTNVSLQSGGVPVKATPPDANGKFALYPVPAGSYDLVVTSAGHVTAVMTGVPVTTTTLTLVNSTTARITPAASVVSTVTGTVTPTTATVRAMQALSGGPTVEVAWAPVDADTGRFDFVLPIGAPVRATYTTNPLTVTFTVDASPAGLYRLDAELNGAVKPQAVNFNAPPVGPVTFTFP
jgi:Domain of unknown function (DUF4382)